MNERLMAGNLAPSEYGRVSKQLNEATKVLSLSSALDSKLAERDDLQEMVAAGGKSDDELELVEMARAELQTCMGEIDTMEDSIKMMLLPKDEDDDKSVVVEIRATAGGDEAALFAHDLFL